jgi:hypothetical protein
LEFGIWNLELWNLETMEQRNGTSPEKKIIFTAKIEQHPGMDAGYIVFPFDTFKLFRVKGQIKVKARFDHAVEYRGSLAKMGLPCHVLGITKEVRYLLGKTFGDEIHVELEKDTEERVVAVPGDVAAILKANIKARKFYESLSYTDQKEYIRWIETTQNPETRARRIGIFIEKLKEGKKYMEK